MAAYRVLLLLSLLANARSCSCLELFSSAKHSGCPVLGKTNLNLRGGGFPWQNLFQKTTESENVQAKQIQSVPQEVTAPPPAQNQPAQVSLVTHAIDHAIAGSLDGIRAGVSQGVGGEFASFVQAALHNGAGLGKAASRLAFASLFAGLPHLRFNQEKRAMCAVPSTSSEALDDRLCVCFVTSPSAAVADNLSIALVESNSVACVNQIPGVTSVYMWEGKINRDSEVLLVLKTVRSKVDSVAALIKEKHPYNVPELVVMDVVDGLPDYLGWVRHVVEAKRAPPATS